MSALSTEQQQALDGITDIARLLSQHVIWQAQTVHAAYHQDISGAWQQCPRDVCASTMYLFAQVTDPEQAAR